MVGSAPGSITVTGPVGTIQQRTRKANGVSEAEISLAIPAQSRFVALARVTTAGLAAEMDFGVDQIDDLRTGVNELVAILVEWAEDHGGSQVALTFRAGADALEIFGEVPDAVEHDGGADEVLDELTGTILGAVVDDHEVGPGRGRVLKRRVRG